VASVSDNPTRKWLSLSETRLLANGTCCERSLASIDRFNWLDEEERVDLVVNHGMHSLELLAEIHIERPGYLHMMPGNAAGVTSCDKRRRQQQTQQQSLLPLPLQLLQQQQQQVQPPPLWGSWKHQQLKALEDHLRAKSKKKVNDNDVHNEAGAITDSSVTPVSVAATASASAPSDRLWVTGFSLTGRQGLLQSVDCDTGVMTRVDRRAARSLLWPNEVAKVPRSLIADVVDSASPPLAVGDANNATVATAYKDALLVSDGFLVPGKDRGGVYVVQNPGDRETERTVSLTGPGMAVTTVASADSSSFDHADSFRWFYHRAVWADLTGDGRKSILTARCKVTTSLGNIQVTSGLTKTCELVCLECPKPASIDPVTGTPLEEDGSVFDPFAVRHLPWKMHILASGPDVMFCIADLDAEDNTIEVLSSQFFGTKVSLYSIHRGTTPRVTFQRVIDDQCGAAFGSILADLDGNTGALARPTVIDSGSTVETLRPGDAFSHLLVTSHECAYSNDGSENSAHESTASYNNDVDGGSLFAYRVPPGKDNWKTEPWIRSTVASGFKVNGQLRNMINPGAPGLVYTFHAKESDIGSSKRPIIAVAGDCAESAYLFRPEERHEGRARNADGADTAASSAEIDASTRYKLMVEIQCAATVGSIAIGYDDFSSTDQESGFAKIYIPCYEKDRILVFALGSGEDDANAGVVDFNEDNDEDGW